MNIAIIGLGLMGTSFGRALNKNTNHKIFGYDINSQVMLKAQLLSAINSPLEKENLKDVDILVVSVFPKDFVSAIKEYLPYLKKGAVILDFCGVKRSILTQMKKLQKEFCDLYFIGGHPMAGREFSGVDHSQATLFNKASMILVPLKDDIFIQSKIKELFLSIGCEQVVITNADTHDKNIAYTSQLCHIVSSAFIKSPTAKEHFGFSAGSYKDMTRVARLNSQMWTQLILDNSDYLASEVECLIKNLNEYLTAIKKKDQDKLFQLLKEGNDQKISIDLGKKQ